MSNIYKDISKNLILHGCHSEPKAKNPVKTGILRLSPQDDNAENKVFSIAYKIISAFIVVLVFALATANISLAGNSVNVSELIGHKGFNPAKTSIMIADASTGRAMGSFSPNVSLIPASCAKLFTAAAALSILGPDHTFKTDFYTDKRYSGGSIGTLYVHGTGDPMLVNEELEKMASDLYSRGLRRVTGGVVIDNSFFDSYDFPRKDTGHGRAYTAKTASTAVNFNSIGVKVSPGRKAGLPAVVTLEPPVDSIDIINKTVTGGKKGGISITMKKNGDRDAVVVTGRISRKAGEQLIYRSVHDPALYAAGAIRYALKQAGIKIEGASRAGLTPHDAVKIASEDSRPLSEIVQQMNKRSNNFIAEQIVKHLGAVKKGAPGSTAKGIAVINEYLASIGIPKGELKLENGSGLSEISSVSAKHLVWVLVAMYKDHKLRNVFMDSLSVMGIDGTTKNWKFAPELIGRIMVKTGTISGVSTLAGYAPTRSGATAAFAILINDTPKGPWNAHRAEVEIVKAITEAH